MRTVLRIPGSEATTPGGPFWVRRVVLVLALAIVATVPAGARAADEDGEQVRLQEEDGLYTVAAQFLVQVPAATAMEVLTDYENIPRFLPDVRTSIVRERTSGRVVIEQEAVAKVMMFSRRIHLVLEIVQTAGEIAFRDLCGRSFQRYEGTWRVFEDGDAVRVEYALTARPSTGIPAFFVRRLLEGDVKDTIRRLQLEMIARTARPVSAAESGAAGSVPATPAEEPRTE
jgi:ribosome-associated toxin RatA of RatAB toxin-antitoxin module